MKIPSIPLSFLQPAFLAGVMLLAIGSPARGADVPQAELPKASRSFIDSRCIDCHDADSKKGGLDLTALPVRLDDPVLNAKWTLVYDRVRRGEMPPKKKDPPPSQERDGFLQSLGDFLTKYDSAREAVGGRVVLRRLNRAEYENTVHDLLGIETPLTDLLPEDAAAYGFDNVADALRLSASQIDAYLIAADKALDAAIDFGPDPRIKRRMSFLDEQRVKNALDRPHNSLNSDGTRYERLVGSEGDSYLLFENDTQSRVELSNAPVAGRYRLRLSASAYHSSGHPVVGAKIWGTNYQTNHVLGAFDFTSDKPREAETTALMYEGESFYLTAAGCDATAPDKSDLHKVGSEKFTGQGLAVQWLEIEGPLLDSWPPPGVSRVFGDVPVKRLERNKGRRAYEVVPANPPEDAARAVTGFARRAFRQPVTAQVAARYVQVAEQALADGATFEDAVRRACKAILTSPEFLFLHEERGQLDDYALASRLSYFLWNTMPDDELLQLAAAGKLKEPATLRAQTQRLLDSPRSHTFTRNFCGQWFNLRAIDATTPDHDLYPEYDPLLKDAMVGETEAFIDEMLRSDLGVATLIDSDFAMLNRRLAELYDIPGVSGEELRKVPLPPNSHRGGIMTQASILKITANGTLSSPVTRGAWVVKRLIGRQLQPPPPDAGSIEPDTRGATTIREQLDKHRHSERCAVCHQYMDPPGFAMENYDVIGGWREWYRSQGKGDAVPLIDRTTGRTNWVRRGLPVDPSGELPDGRKFANMEEFKKLLSDQQDAIAQNLVNNLVTYSTGAGVTFADRGEVQAILQRAKPHSYGLRTLVTEVVQSRLFQTK
ncbi:MAG TPA: DUF1592 domain-containing protein [Tepidisphaeraceae bacterium]|nr:DUF1592 domain-containing protein [Tepidisphaeraceae bacterium]